MKTLSIRAKLLLLFVVMKVIPLLVIFYIAFVGALKLEEYLNSSTKVLFDENIKILKNTTDVAIQDSIVALDEKSQNALEKASSDIANSVASFLYERDNDVLFLSTLNINQKVLQDFYNAKLRDITLHGEYYYDKATGTFKTKEEVLPKQREIKTAILKDNAEEFNYYDPYNFEVKTIPIYKEVSYFDLNGKEKYKVSQIDEKLKDVSVKTNTYVNSEDYFDEIKKLKQGEIYVSDVIGEYVGSKIIGTFNEANAKKQGIPFEPEKHAYSGRENPVGKKFEGIVRFITPVYKNGKRVGYISLALDHLHLREFTSTYDTVNPYNKQNIIDATLGNYAFIWDYEGKSIVHPRDHSIMGYDKNTGELAKPWLSTEVSEAFKKSGKVISEFLKDYPKFDDQGWHKKADLVQIREEGLVGLDCRYLNHAPQCHGWMQLTENGGYGSFIIDWTGVKKLTTAATIPYFTGKYKDSPRGFGFVAIGANVDDFHAATNKTKENIGVLLTEQTGEMRSTIDKNIDEVDGFIAVLLNELSIATTLMIFLVIAIAIWMSKTIISKINNLLDGTHKFSNKEFDHKIKITSNDEIGELEKAFNDMAEKINTLVKEQERENKYLENELYLINQDLEKRIEQTTQTLRETMIKLQNADRVKSNFLSNISHEMRTPLNAIIGFLEVLKMEETDDRKVEYMSLIANNSKTLLAIINDIIDLVKIGDGEIRIAEKSTNIKDMISPQIDFYNNQCEKKGLRFAPNISEVESIQIMADRVHLRQILSQIINNAVKFTPSGGQVDFIISKVSESEKYINMRFLVRDTGVGISEDKIDKIFDLFTQADEEANRQFEGIGLGLNLCSQVLEHFGSSIQVESQVDVGSTFWFDLKFEKCFEMSAKQKEERIIENTQLIIINNNPLSKELMAHIFKAIKIDFNFVANVEEFDKMEENSNSIVIIDYELLIKYKNSSKNIANQMVVLTQTQISAKEKIELKDYKVIEYIKKPLRADELKKVLVDFGLKNNSLKVIDAKESVEDEKEKEETIVRKSSFPPYQKDDAIKQLQLEEEIVDMLLGSFFEALDGDIEKLQNAIDSKNADDISKAAHYLKGSCANLAMKEPMEILFDIETKSKDNGETNFDLTSLKDSLQRIKDIISI